MPPKSHNSFLYIGASMFLIVGAIAATAIFRRNDTSSGTDIRAKAGVSASLRLTGNVSGADDTNGTLTVSNLKFMDSQDTTTLGTWTVTPPEGSSVSSYPVGANIVLTINPNTFLVTSHTVTATQIVVNK